MGINVFRVLVFVLLFGLSWQTKAEQKGIQVQIKHENKLIYDTVINESDAGSKELIESLVMRFSKDSIKLSSENVHGLYVFHIDNEKWKTEAIPATYSNEAWQSENLLNSDSLLNELSKELDDNNYTTITIEMAVDSLADAFEDIGDAFSTLRFESDDEIDLIRDSFEELFRKVKSTKVVFTQK